MRFISVCIPLLVLGLLGDRNADAALYRVVPSATNMLAGETTGLRVEVETQAGDNLIGVGHFSFAIDLSLTDSAGVADGSAISNVLINTTDFNDIGSQHLGSAQDALYKGVAAATSDIFAPNFGRDAGDVIQLFTFDFTMPVGAPIGDTVIITPSEGFLGNLTVNTNFAPVFPQNFVAGALTVIPEPATLTLLALGGLLAFRRACWCRLASVYDPASKASLCQHA